MIGHLRMLMKLNRLNENSIDILRNLSLMQVSGVYKSAFKMWLELDPLKNVNELIRYGIISEDTENKTIALHPLIYLFLPAKAADTCPTYDHNHEKPCNRCIISGFWNIILYCTSRLQCIVCSIHKFIIHLRCRGSSSVQAKGR